MCSLIAFWVFPLFPVWLSSAEAASCENRRLCLFFCVQPKAHIRIPACLLFLSAGSFPRSVSSSFGSFSHVGPSLHLPLVNSVEVTKHIDLFMLAQLSFPVTLRGTHIHHQSVCFCVCLSVKPHVTVMLNGVSLPCCDKIERAGARAWNTRSHTGSVMLT